MITKEQAVNAIKYLEAAAMNMQFEDKEHKEYNRVMRQGAVKVLREYIDQNESDVKIVYEYKLRDEMTGMYRDASNWTKKGKTYRSRNNMNSAIAYAIESFIRKVEPRYYIYKDGKNYDNPNYHEEYRAFRNNNANKEWRAKFIPETFIVECIPVNTKADILRINARDFYLGKDK